MTQVGVGESREVCGECGAVIGNRERHTQWHELLDTVLPDIDQVLSDVPPDFKAGQYEGTAASSGASGKPGAVQVNSPNRP